MKIEGTHGPVSITLIGVHDVAKMLYMTTKDIEILTKEQLLRSATEVAYEVQQSIIGNRAETKSVDTGNFANSIQVSQVQATSLGGDISIYSDIEYAKFLEFGTSKMQPRAHFQNTAFRVEPKIKEDFNVMITKVCRKAK